MNLRSKQPINYPFNIMVSDAVSILLSTTNAKLQFSQFDQYIRCSAPLKHECLHTPWEPAAEHNSTQHNHNQFSLACQSAFSFTQFGSTRPPQFMNLTSTLKADVTLTRSKSVITRIPQNITHISLCYIRSSLII
jgi:hypothetical protein